MCTRRAVLRGIAVVVGGSTTGCLDTLQGGNLAGGVDPSRLAAKKGDVMEQYDQALTERNDGVTERETAVAEFNNEAYDQAIQTFETAHDHFVASKDGFAAAAELAYEIGEDEAGDLSNLAKREVQLQLDATAAGLDAAQSAQRGNAAEDVNSHVREYQDLVDSAKQMDLENAEEIFEILQSD